MKNVNKRLIHVFKITYTILLVFILFKQAFTQEDLNLKNVFTGYFLIGVALGTEQILEEDEIAAPLITKHFNSITAENAMKWERIHPSLDEYNFELTDRFISFGEYHNMSIIGHTLIWHQQTPEWVFKNEDRNTLDRDGLLKRMSDHINTVVGRYKGKIKGWDVVNEALNEDGSLRNSEWLNIIGEDYLLKAFEFAHQADLNAELYYNDFSLENEPKRKGAIELIRKLKANGIKIDGVGLQGHYKMDWPTTAQLDSTIKAFADLGLKVMITELDIDVLPYKGLDYSADISLNVESREELNPYQNGLPEPMQQLLAERYSDLFKVLISNNETVSRVTFWGIYDGDSWLNNWPVRGRTNYPLLFDREGEPKPAFEAVIKIVENWKN